MKEKIAITTTTFGEHSPKPERLLKENGFEIVKNDLKRVLSADEILFFCGGCAGIVAGTEKYDRNTLKKLSGLKAISRVGVGVDNIDAKAAQEFGIKVVNTPFGPVNAVAELTIGLILNLLRRISEMDREMRSGKWNKMTGNLLSGKRVGIIGFGRIGQRVSALLGLLGCEILYTDIVGKDGAAGARKAGLEELLKDSDIVSVHVSSGDKILGETELRRMKKGALLVNVSRGGVVDEDALYRALKDGHLGGAAIDVFGKEPYKGALSELNNTILTPHIGSYALESRVEMELAAVENLIKILKGAI